MAYTGQQRFLLRDAEKYSSLGYKVGYCKGKEYLGEYQPPSLGWSGISWAPAQNEAPDDFDGISLIPERIVCIDFDSIDFDVGGESLPPTLKERTPRGWHLFYRLPLVHMCQPRIKWKPHVDLLVKPNRPPKKASRYGGIKDDGSVWGEHVLISPTSGYTRIWPEEVPKVLDLPEAPLWLLDVLGR
jgi:hypothetical protein